jgi:hypothetical protein
MLLFRYFRGLALVSIVCLLFGCDLASSYSPDAVERAVSRLSQTRETQSAEVLAIVRSIESEPRAQLLLRLIEYLDDAQPTRRRAAIYLLQHIEWHDPSPAWPKLRGLLQHEEDTTRGMATLALGWMRDPFSIQPILNMAQNDPSAYAKRCATAALGEYEELDPESLAELQKLAAEMHDDISINARSSVDRLLFLPSLLKLPPQQAIAAKGIWLIAGTPAHDLVRLSYAFRNLGAVSPEDRQAVYAHALEYDSLFLHNSAYFAALFFQDPLELARPNDQFAYEIVQNEVAKLPLHPAEFTNPEPIEDRTDEFKEGISARLESVRDIAPDAYRDKKGLHSILDDILRDTSNPRSTIDIMFLKEAALEMLAWKAEADPIANWRLYSLLGEIAEIQDRPLEALDYYRAAIRLYPDVDYSVPSKTSYLQHLYNKCGMIRAQRDLEEAEKGFFADYLEDPRWTFIFAHPWQQMYTEIGQPDRILLFKSRAKQAYQEKAERYPEQKERLMGYVEELENQ